ncbi:MAG: hypothetical protein JJ864_07890 [Rhizobiaceae bacterium]|nr:hypothetical protein [Rhizobiaceae bacterium]
MKKLILALGLALAGYGTLVTSDAQAANCLRNFTFKNTTGGLVRFKIESRTRANAQWYDGGLVFSDRKDIIHSGGTKTGTISYPVLGCGVKRKIRIKVTCLNLSERAIGRRVINVSRGEWHKPYDLKSDLKCS